MPTGTDAIWQWVWRSTPIGLVFLAGFLAVRYTTRMPGRSYQGVLEPLPEHELALRDQLKAHIVMLAGALQGGNPSLDQALDAGPGVINQHIPGKGYNPPGPIFVGEGKNLKNLPARVHAKTAP